VKPSNPANDNLIDQTIALWQPRLGRNLSREDARQIAENVTGFFTTLAKWSRAEMSAAVNDNNLRPKASDKEDEKRSGEIIEQGERGRSRP
jgi:hypothetical protein